MATQRFAGKINAPRFPVGANWLNTDRPLTWADLRGKVVVLDFWTYCCINCMHILPDLKRLEHKYPNELVVVGVHSAKFTTERETDNIRQAILRYEIEHPVVNDADFRLWSEYAVRAWPTLFIVDPTGRVYGALSGENVYEPFDCIIGQMIEEFDARGLIDRRPLGLRRERAVAAESLLAYPGKVVADAASDRLFIADSGHNRIIVAGLDGAVRQVYGDGQAALLDGLAEVAAFHHPQGMALDGETLYVADTENHAVRAIDLAAGRVRTVAGTGAQARQFNRPGTGRQVALNSPWDLVVHDGALYVAMAGSHQLWRIDPASGYAEPWAGSAREALADGPRREAALAQPSGVTTDGRRLYFVDSETSSLRAADLTPDGEVWTIVGQGLFEFGDVDGAGDEVRLQHPLGVAWNGNQLYVADAYNNKLKVADPGARTVLTLIGDGRPGDQDGVGAGARLDEPGGLSIAGDQLYVADTNNHLIRVVDLPTLATRTLTLTGLAAMPPAAAEAMPERAITLPALTLAPGPASLLIDVRPPAGYDLNTEAPVSLTVHIERPIDTGESLRRRIPAGDLPARLETAITPDATGLTIDLVAYYCRHGRAAVCLVERARLAAPLTLAAGGGHEATIEYRIAEPALV
jgi:thiol-disulfide isomerase/thioredoxin